MLDQQGRSEYRLTQGASDGSVAFCKAIPPERWFALAKWLKERGFMQGKQRSQCFVMGRTLKGGKKDPSPVLSTACQNIWEKAVNGYGFDPETT